MAAARVASEWNTFCSSESPKATMCPRGASVAAVCARPSATGATTSNTKIRNREARACRLILDQNTLSHVSLRPQQLWAMRGDGPLSVLEHRQGPQNFGNRLLRRLRIDDDDVRRTA